MPAGQAVGTEALAGKRSAVTAKPSLRIAILLAPVARKWGFTRMQKLTTLVCATAFGLGPMLHAQLDPANLDRSVKPEDDFFRFANGGWLKTATIPPEQSMWGSFVELNENNRKILHALCDQAAAKTAAKTVTATATAAEQLVGDFYASGMDEAAIEAAGSQPLKPEFERIAAIQSPAGVMLAIARLHRLGVGAGFGFGSGPDSKDSSTVIAEMGQGGITLPAGAGRGADCDYYLNPEPKYVKIRGQYVAHVAKMLELCGDEPAAAQSGAESVLRLETKLATVYLNRVKLRDPNLSYHKIKVADLAKTTGDLDWAAYFKAVGAPPFEEINLAHPEFFTGFAEALRSTPVAEWQTYLRWHLVQASASYLSKPFVDEKFRFFGTIISGIEQQRPRWQRVVAMTDTLLSQALGQLYVARYFPPAAKTRVLKLVADLRAALHERLTTLEWMDDATRAKAIAKLDAFDVKMGYPDQWKDYGSLKLDRQSLVLNIFRINEFENALDLAKIGKPVDKSEWFMSAAAVNAYYSPSSNGITFPAGILQPPFFDLHADDALNYGGIGTVIGHEMTHGFDDSGRQFDAKGNLSDWWTPECAARFKEKSAAIVMQFSAFSSAGIHVNGELTQGENIADLGGLKISYAAFQKSLGDQPRKLIDGFTPDQRFFLNYANLWRSVMRPEEERRLITTDPHSPNEWRVRGPLSNLDEFARAFNIPEGSPMRRPAKDRIDIW